MFINSIYHVSFRYIIFNFCDFRRYSESNRPWFHFSDQHLSKVFNATLKDRFDVSRLNGGFLGYEKSFVIYLNNNNDLVSLRKEVVKFLSTLSDKTLYSLLPVCSFLNRNNSLVYKSIFKESIKISKDSVPSVVSDPLHLALDYNLIKYGLESVDQVVLFYKVWLKEDDLKVAYADAVKTLDQVNLRRLSENKIVNQIGDSVVEPSKVPLEIKNLKRNPLFAPLFNPNLLNYNDLSLNNSLQYSNDFILKVTDVTTEFCSCDVFNSDNVKVLSFYDSFNVAPNTIVRVYNDLVLKFVDNLLVHTDITIRMGELLEVPQELLIDKNIGTIDLETFPSQDDPSLLSVYACAYSVAEETRTYFLGHNDLNTSESLIIQMFTDIFQRRWTHNTFYAHNLGRFDGHFLIKTLTNSGFDVFPNFKDDKTIISLKIRINVTGPKGGLAKKVTLTLYDSLLLLKSSLKSLCKDFNPEVLKSDFPHSFANLPNLSYVGPTPPLSYFNDLSESDYNSLYSDSWSFKDECLKYLINDVQSLRHLLLIFSSEIYEAFNINLTSYKTLPSLAFNIFLSNFYKRKDNPIKVIKGDIEKTIRSAYLGGLSFVFEHELKNGYQYDINSHYPACMKLPLPIGNPTYTDNKNLSELFGFVRAKVTAPAVTSLKNLFLPIKTEDGLICPRGTFYGWWFSEELKNAAAHGYEVSVIGAWTFSKSTNLFDDYVDTLYSIKANSDSNPSKRNTAKLLLNSLYGRMGLNEIDNRVKIISTAELDTFLKKVNAKEIINLGRYSIVIYSGRLDLDLLKLVDSDDLHVPSDLLSKRRGVPSSVSIAAAITAYARLEISKYFNLPDNKCIATDTDMIVLEKPLDPSLIGPELGKFKLEYKIDHGIYISPKTYCIKYNNPKKEGKEEYIYRAKGLGGNHLDYKDYINLLDGIDVIKAKTYFEPAPELGGVRIFNRPFTIKGLQKK